MTAARRLAPRALAALVAMAARLQRLESRRRQRHLDGGTPPASTFLYAGGGAHLHAFRMDLTSGALAFLAREPAGDDARIHELDAARRRVYVQTQIGSPLVIVSYALGADGRLTLIADQALPYPLVEGMTQLGLHPTEPWMLVSATNASPGLEDQLMPVRARRTAGHAPDHRQGVLRLRLGSHREVLLRPRWRGDLPVQLRRRLRRSAAP